MKPHHRTHLWATLKTIDRTLESHEIQLANERNVQDILSLIQDIRNNINSFLREFGIAEKKQNELWKLFVSCSFIKNYLVDLEPNRFQQAYGKFDSIDEAKRLDDLLVTLRGKTAQLERAIKNAHPDSNML